MYTSRLLLLFILSLVTLLSGQAQISGPNGTLFGNEWIDFNRQTLKLEVGQDGIHKIDAAQMQAAGFDFQLGQDYEFQGLPVEIDPLIAK
ncbi:MAG: hypothetical protein AAFO91_09690 [Bacteroidota bacterium]